MKIRWEIDMFNKISDMIIFTCTKCGRTCNPYAEFNIFGVSVEQIFYNMPPCPECGAKKWNSQN